MVDFSINLYLDLPITRLIQVAQEAEIRGFKRCWVYDEGLATRDPFITLAAIALKTKTIMLGTGITNPYTRHPGITAASIAALDELSGGRAFLGVGSGGSLTLSPLGIAVKRPLKTVREMIVTSRALFKGETLSYKGETVQYNQAKLSYTRPDIEIWLAGRGPKLLTLGGEVADGVVLSFVLKDQFQLWLDLIQTGAKISGNKPRVCFSTPIIISAKTLEETKPHMTYRLINISPDVRKKIGITEEEISSIREVITCNGIIEAGKMVKDSWLKPFVIMGSLEECKTELVKLFKRYDISEIQIPLFNASSAQRVMIEAQQVLEAFR